MRLLKTISKLLILVIGIVLVSAFNPKQAPMATENRMADQVDTLKQTALSILQTKCNVCHKKQNPFKVFSEKNMAKHAPKIHKQVFVKQRMPKGDIKLTTTEYTVLKQWLSTKNIK